MKKFFEGNKIIIHMFYWLVILALCNVCTFTVRGYDNRDLNAMFCFGATLVGIILSVLAIMITLLGEFKSENTKDTLERVSTQIEQITKKDLASVSEKLENFSLNTLDNVTQKLENMMNEIDSTSKKLSNIEKMNDAMSEMASDVKDVKQNVFKNSRKDNEFENSQKKIMITCIIVTVKFLITITMKEKLEQNDKLLQ